MSPPSKGLSYRAAGVDLEAADRTKSALKELVEATRNEHTLSELGQFGGLYRLPGDVDEPVLVSSADGVGTKLKVAFRSGRHTTVGQDLVNHCVNDILVQGARPLFFLDYIACGTLEEGVVEDIVRGLATACKANECALLGGETAQMPDFYAAGEYDLAGFIVGVVPQAGILDGSRVAEGDALIGVSSSGLHTNGYSLAREIVFGRMELDIEDEMPGLGRSVADTLLEVHRSYLPAFGPMMGRGTLKALAHITGGGVPGNLPRVLPEGLGAVVRRRSWQVPHLFALLAEAGDVAAAEMDRVFNMGIGMIAIVEAGAAPELVAVLRGRGEDAWLLGEVEPGHGVRYEP